MLWRLSFIAIFCTIVTPAIADSRAFTKCVEAFFSRELLETPRPTPADFEKIIQGACLSEEVKMAKEEHIPYMEQIGGMDMTEEHQHVDKENKEGDERRAQYEQKIRDIEISYYTQFYYSHPQ